MLYLSYSYDGDKLATLSGTHSGTLFSSTYGYDGNGNMTFDGDQQMKLGYDINNLVHDVKKIQSQRQNQTEELTATYSYFADGTKYYIKDTSGNGRIYIGPFTLARKDYQSANSGNTTVQYITLLESADVLGSDARFAFAATPQNPSGTDTTYTVSYETLYLLKDHLSSVRAITDSQGNTLERNDYYPYGLQTSIGRNYATLEDKYRVRMPSSFTSGNPSISNLSISSPSIEMAPLRMLYNGKELQMVAQTRLIDYGARQYDPVIARWNGMDPKAERTYLSGYTYCVGNSIIFKDYYGNDFYEYIDEMNIPQYKWFASKEKQYTDENGVIWHNIGTTFLQIVGYKAILYTQSIDKDGNLFFNEGKEFDLFYTEDLYDLDAMLSTFSSITGIIGFNLRISKATLRFTNSKGVLDFHLYFNGWVGNRFVKTKKVSSFGKIIGRISTATDLVSLGLDISDLCNSNNIEEAAKSTMDIVIDASCMSPYTAPFALVWHLGLKDGFYYWKEEALTTEIENDTYWYPDHLPFK